MQMVSIDWTLSLWIEHRVAEIITQQVANGVLFDKESALDLLDKIAVEKAEIEERIRPLLYLDMQRIGTYVKKPFMKDGSYSKAVLEHYPANPEIVWGQFSRIEWVELQLSQREKLKDQLMKAGWKPENYTDKGSPQFTIKNEYGETIACPSLERTLGEKGALVARYSVISHREGQVKGWVYGTKNNGFVSPIRADGRIPAGAITCGTNTGRAVHRTIVNIPRPNSPLGKEMRSLFIVPSDKVLVGSDLEGLELRCLAHRMNDYLYTDILLNGDIHWHNAQSMGLVPYGTLRDKHNAALEVFRDMSKKICYTTLYGAGLGKIADTINDSERRAKEIRDNFYANTPALSDLIEGVKKASKRGWLKGLDGRKIWMRRSEDGKVTEHKALNTLLQSDGAIISKMWLIEIDERIIKNPRFSSPKQLWWMHDEVGIECVPEEADEIGELLKECARIAGEKLKLNLPIAANYSVGRSWCDVH